MSNYRALFINLADGEADGASMVGRVVNVYSTYRGALDHGANALLADVREVNRLTYLVGGIVSQTAKTAGPTVDNNGILAIAVDSNAHSEIYLACEAGRFGGPRRIAVSDTGTELDSESSSSESSREYSSMSSSSQSSSNSSSESSASISNSSDSSSDSSSSSMMSSSSPSSSNSSSSSLEYSSWSSSSESSNSSSSSTSSSSQSSSSS